MKKLFRLSVAFVMGVMTLMGVRAQEMPQLPPMPVDPAVKTGVLPNGLTYYIRHNETPKGQADFYIAQKVGSVLEEDNQRGLAHFLEHMCFNGTTNFPGKTMIEWLESNGVKFGVNLNAYTDVDETVYNISSVPVARQGVQDSCLLILHDWANSLLLEPEEIDAERGVIHEEWRMRMVGQMRLIEKLLPTVYPDNKYAYRLPIGTMEVVDNFPPQAIVDYYHTWYRPDQQGIIVVGDIDPEYIEKKIIEIFSPIEMPANAKPREIVEVQNTPGTIYAIGADPEVSAPVAMFMIKTPDAHLIPTEMRNTQAFYPVQYLTTVVEEMFNQRLHDLAGSADSEFAQASAGFGRFFVSPSKDAFTIQIIGKGGDITPAIQSGYREFLRAAKGGFTQGELDRANAEIRSRYQRMYDSRNNTPSESYSRELVRSFIDNDPIPGIETEKQLMDAMTQMIPVQAVNQLLAEMAGPDNRVLLVMMPENENYTVPTEEGLAAALAAVDAEEIEPYKDTMKEEPLIPALPAPGKIVAESHNAQWDATEYTLSNGIKVIVKPSQLKDNEIVFEAMAKGGYSVFPDEYASSIIFMPMAMSRHGLGTYTASDIQKYLQGKQISINVEVDAYRREVSGMTTIQDLPTLMELIYANFTEFEFNAEDFAGVQSMIKGALANQEKTPDYTFIKNVKNVLFKAPAEQQITSAIIDEASADQIKTIVKESLANPTDFTFVFTGNIDLDTFKPLLEQYIATIPVANNDIVQYEPKPGFEPVTGTATTTGSTAMETPQVWAFYMIGATEPYDTKNQLMTEMVASVLSTRLLNKVREEMGATYSIGAHGVLSRFNTGINTLFQIAFPMKPELKDEVFAAIDNILTETGKNITAEEVKPVREYIAKQYAASLEENTTYADAIADSATVGSDTFHNRMEVLDSITIADLENFWNNVLSQGNRQLIILEPAQ